ncbi:MAG: YceI family protein [Ferruginibacter sp.]
MAKTKWVIDNTHSELSFKIKHLMITNVSGTFKNFHVQAETDDEDFSTAQIKVTAEMASISTNNEQRDIHLLTGDFFEVEKYPELVFRSTKLEKTGEDAFYLFGDLTIKGVTKKVKLNLEYSGVVGDPWGGERAGFVVTGKINRSDWGVSFNGILETGGLMLSEEVRIIGEIQLVKEVVAVAVEV